MNINTEVEKMKFEFLGSIYKIEDNWDDYYKDVSDGQSIFEMALQNVGYFSFFDELEKEGIDFEFIMKEEVKEALFDIYEECHS